MENTWIFLLLGIISSFVTLSAHERIRQMRTNPFVLRMDFGLKLERVVYAVFSVFFFALWLII